MKNSYTDESELIEDLNLLLKGGSYNGYVQFSHKAIEDIFKDKNIVINKQEKGFIFEAHFSNPKESITIRRINEKWYVDIQNLEKTKDCEIVTCKYKSRPSLCNYDVKMVQIWEVKPDEFCEGMDVSKLKKVVFAGFEDKCKGDKS